MKEKILILLIGILIGAIIATTGFLIYSKLNPKSNMQPLEMMQGNGQMREMDGRMQGEPPQRPEDMNNSERMNKMQERQTDNKESKKDDNNSNTI